MNGPAARQSSLPAERRRSLPLNPFSGRPLRSYIYTAALRRRLSVARNAAAAA